MKRPLIKVDRVASVEEARALAALGVGEMTVSLAAPGESSFGDGREITPEEARQMMAALPEVRWGLFLPGGCSGAAHFPPMPSPDTTFVQVPYNQVGEVAGLTPLEVVAWGISADHDEDPAWTRANLQEATQAGAGRCAVHVYPSVRDGWAQALESVSPYHELREPDVRRLACQFPVLVEADFRPEHLAALGDSPFLGVNLTLSPWHRSFGEVVWLLTDWSYRVPP